MTTALRLLAARLRAVCVLAIFALDPALIAAICAVALPAANLFWKG